MPSPKRFLKYGGVEFHQLADDTTLQSFVSNLPDEKRTSMYEVAKALSDAGLIEIPDDPEFSTIDADFLAWLDHEDEAHEPYPADLCPACRAPLRFTADVRDGTLIECAHCGADLTVTHNNGAVDLRLQSEMSQK